MRPPALPLPVRRIRARLASQLQDPARGYVAVDVVLDRLAFALHFYGRTLAAARRASSPDGRAAFLRLAEGQRRSALAEAEVLGLLPQGAVAGPRRLPVGVEDRDLAALVAGGRGQ